MADESTEQTEGTEAEGAEAVEETVEPEAVEETPADEPAAGAEEPVAEAEADPVADAETETEETAPEEAATEVAPPAEKKKRKRLPRSLRRQRPKPVRERPAERKPITRLPKPEHARGRRQERQGTVVSAGADKTIVVRVDVVKLHPVYKKVIRRSTKLHAHDEQNSAKVGDIVRVVETRPLSKLKRWRLREIVQEAK
jgi:small subunit ribosomal protein S17